MEEASRIDRDIGASVRVLRIAAGLTLDDLAGRSGVSRAMLSRIERGESSPTAQLLNRVCGGLGVTLAALFAGAESPAAPLARRAEQALWRDPGSGYLRRAVSPPGTGSPCRIAEIEFPPGASVAFDNQRLEGTDQHVWVLDGVLELELGDEVFRLETGDCLHMRFGKPVVYRNPGRRAVRYAVIVGHAGARP